MDFKLPSFTPDNILSHYENTWSRKATALRQWTPGPSWQMPQGFSIAEFEPYAHRRMWTYATCGMSCQRDAVALELHLFSPIHSLSLVELLTTVAHYHLTGDYLGLNHTVNFGRPWLPESLATHGLISLPYLDGPRLERSRIEEKEVLFCWLIPITAAEKEFAKENGVDALEAMFERAKFNYLDPKRLSVVK
jgi:hypothetical protein